MSLADQLSTGLPGAPQPGAGVHVGAGLRAWAKGQLTLTMQAVAGAGQVVWERQLLLRLVQQTVSYRNKTNSLSNQTAAIFHIDMKIRVTLWLWCGSGQRLFYLKPS